MDTNIGEISWSHLPQLPLSFEIWGGKTRIFTKTATGEKIVIKSLNKTSVAYFLRQKCNYLKKAFITKCGCWREMKIRIDLLVTSTIYQCKSETVVSKTRHEIAKWQSIQIILQDLTQKCKQQMQGHYKHDNLLKQ